MRRSRGLTGLLAAALLAEAALLSVDVLAGEGFRGRGLYVVPVLAMAVRASVRDTALAGMVAVALAALSPVWNGGSAEEHLVPLVTVIAGAAIATWGARERSIAIQERRQMGLLADVARMGGGAADVGQVLSGVLDLLVPDFADGAWFDLLEEDGGVRRHATRMHGPDAGELEAWFNARDPAPEGRPSPTLRAVRGEGSQLVELDHALLDAITFGPQDRRRMEQAGTRWIVAVPLVTGGRVLGALGLGVGRSGRRYDAGDLRFAEVLAGRAALVVRNAQLLTRLRAAQERLDGILGALVEAVTVHDAEGRMVYANQGAADLLGVGSVDAVLAARPEELADLFEQRHPDGRPVALEEYPGFQLMRGGEGAPVLTRSIRRADGRAFWLFTKARLLHEPGGGTLAVNVIEDVTEQRDAALRESFLAQAGEALASSLDYEETLARVARLAVPGIADWCSVELPDERGVLRQVGIAHVDPAKVALGREFRDRYPPDPDGPTGSPAVMRTGRPQLYEHVPRDLLAGAARDEEHLRLILALGITSVMVVPMVTGGRVLGVMSFVSAESGRRFGERDLAFAQDFAARAATAVENARLYTELRGIASTLQASLLPERLPAVPGWDTATAYRPGQRGAEVGGDFYDVFPVGDGHMLLLGDVTGKGIAAAALTSLVRHTAKTAAIFDPRPAAVLALVNRVLREQDRIAPVTMICGVLNATDITLAVAGHPLPMLRRASGEVTRIGVPGLLLGAVDEYAHASEALARVAPGDTVLLFTDGVTDTPGDDGRFGERRLAEALREAPAAAADLLASLSSALDAFQRGAVADDRAMLVLHRR